MKGLTLGERIQIMRQRREMTQEALSKRTGVSKMTIIRLEQGHVKDAKGKTLKALAEALGVSIDFLMGLKDEEEEERHGAQPVLAGREA